MVSDFVDQHNGYLRLTDTEFAVGKTADPQMVQMARALLEYGAEHEGYWTSEKFMANIKNAVKIEKHKYPASSYTVCWIFDQSSCHRAFAEDALNAKRMNVRPGGAQLKMRNSVGWASAKDDKGRWDPQGDEDDFRRKGDKHFFNESR